MIKTTSIFLVNLLIQNCFLFLKINLSLNLGIGIYAKFTFDFKSQFFLWIYKDRLLNLLRLNDRTNHLLIEFISN
jgi:hypothetical protein